MTIDIICPIYNGEKYIKNLNESLKTQNNVEIKNIKYILTESKDNSEKVLNEINANYKKIKRQDFSHSIVREKAIFESEAEIAVLITQDVEIKNKNWLYNLTKDINNEIVATYSRQITKYNNIEKYTREKNYPKESKIVSKEDINQLGLKTFFFSDAASAIKRDIFIKLKGYDGKNLPISEDMYIAYKIIMNGYKIKYCADSIVYHSHKFTLKQIYERYKLTGQFFKQNNYLDKYGTNKAGGGLAKYILKRAFQEHNIPVILRWLPDMAARYLGMQAGKRR